MASSCLILAVGATPQPTTTSSASVSLFGLTGEDALSLDEVVVLTGARTDEAVAQLPYATFELRSTDIVGGRPTLSLAESLDRVPGVIVSGGDRYAHNMRISVRGFGATAPSGTRGVRLVLDGIPLTLADGQSQLDVIDPAFLERIEVLRGPASSLYGNASGGVIHLQSRSPPHTMEMRTSKLLGAFRFSKWTAAAGTNLGDTQVSIFASKTHAGGHRDNSAVEQWNFRTSTRTHISDNIQLSTVVHSVSSPVARDAGGLTEEQFGEDPSQAAATNLRFGVGAQSKQLQMGSQLVVDFGKHRLEASVHGGSRDEQAVLPLSLESLSREFYGAMVMYHWKEEQWLEGHRFAVGVETQFQDDQRTREGNIQSQTEDALSLLQTERAHSFGVFAQNQLIVVKRLTLSGGARFDKIDFSLLDGFMADGDGSGRKTMDKFTVQGGLVYRFYPFSIFANLAQSYETPTLSEWANMSVGDGFSYEADMQEALSYEVGLNGNFGQVLGFETSAYLIELRDELIHSEDNQGRSLLSSAGESRRLGAELLGRFQPHPSIYLLGTYAWLHATFEDELRQGLFFPGVPQHRIFGRLSYDDGQVFGAAEVEWVDRRMANDANTAEAPSHTMGEMYVGWRFPATMEWLGELSVGIRNMFAVDYVDRVRVNAFGGRFFDPGAPIHFFGALRLHYGLDSVRY